MSHEDAVVKLPTNFKTIASTKNSKLTIIENSEIKSKWIVVSQIKKLLKEIRNTVKKDKVICALSGGVDSSVVALLINQAIKKNLICIMVDTGLMRKNESNEVISLFAHHYNIPLIHRDASDIFLDGLSGVEDPEEKCKKFTSGTCAGCRIKAQATSDKPQAASSKPQA